MKKVAYVLLVVLLLTAVSARIQWTPLGFVHNGMLITGWQVAEVHTYPSPILTRAECERISNQIMTIFRQRTASSVKIHPRFIEGCSAVGSDLPNVMQI